MQSSSVRTALPLGPLSGTAGGLVHLVREDLGAPAPGGVRARGALMAPVAMLLGALGLAGLWVIAPRGPILTPPAASPPPAAATPQQTSAVVEAALRDDQVLRHLLVDLGAPTRLETPPLVQLTATAAQTLESLKAAEANLVSAADLDARSRFQDLRATFKSTGLDARPYMAATGSGALSPLELRDAKVLAVRLDVDAALARRVQHTARELNTVRALSDAAASLPLSTPVNNPVRSSPFGIRRDPFTGTPTFHPGQDFAGHYGEPIQVTAPGVIAFAGQRAGYGNCVEVDHGHGFKTRYGHLESFTTSIGQAVKTGDVIGRMGSTGRSTGVHLHYEVWASGRLQDPARFLKFAAPSLPG